VESNLDVACVQCSLPEKPFNIAVKSSISTTCASTEAYLGAVPVDLSFILNKSLLDEAAAVDALSHTRTSGLIIPIRASTPWAALHADYLEQGGGGSVAQSSRQSNGLQAMFGNSKLYESILHLVCTSLGQGKGPVIHLVSGVAVCPSILTITDS